MVRRSLAVLALFAGAAAAKPPGLPGDPLPQMKEQSPVEREFYLTPGGRPEPTYRAPAAFDVWRAAVYLGLATPRAAQWF